MRDNFKSRGLQRFFGLSVVVTESCVHSVVKMSLAVPQVLNVISKPNTKVYLEMIQRRMRLEAVSRYEKQRSILKVVRSQGRYYVRRGPGANISFVAPIF